MNTLLKSLRAVLVVLFALTLGSASAQVPDTLIYSIPPPPTGVQPEAGLGRSVAVEGAYIIVGAPYDDTGAEDSGVVKVFDSTTGALRFVISNPSPSANDYFGTSVAISGTRVVVGAEWDDEGAPDAGSAYVYDLSGLTPTVPVATLNNPTPASLDSFGVSIAISGTRVVVGAFNDSGGAGSAYVYDLAGGTPTLLVTTLDNPDPATGDGFGISVAISGTRVVVGAHADDTGVTDSGSVYVYDLNSITPTLPVNTLKMPVRAPYGYFGKSVAISGTRVVVGALTDGTRANDSGVVYVYSLTGSSPTLPVATLSNPISAGPGSSDFGYRIAISGDRLIIGAWQNDSEESDAGSVYVYDLSGSKPTVPMAKLINPHPAPYDFFGAVAISGMRVVVGASAADTIAENAGSAYVYDLSSATPTVAAITLNTPTPLVGDRFGNSVGISGSRMIIGAPFDDTGAEDSGSAYVYDLSSATPMVPVATLHNPSSTAGDNFAKSVAISGTRVVVGVPLDDTGASASGSVYVYDLSSSTPAVPVATLNNPDPAAGDYFGNAVAISGSQVVVGAYFDDTGANAAGSAYVYDLSSSSPTVPVTALNNPNPTENDFFGYSVSISGTVVVVGAFYSDTGATSAGSAYVYDLSNSAPTIPMFTLNSPSPTAYDRFGVAVAISGNRVVVGASGSDAGMIDAGISFVYDLSSGTPTVPVATLNNPSPSAYGRFGDSVAISGTRVVVGAYGYDMGATDTGSAYVYDLTSPTPTVPVITLNNPSPADGDHFGISVAIEGTRVAIGSPDDDTVTTDKGFAYVFDATSNTTASPTLAAPVTGVIIADTVNVSFSLPEAALPGSVKLSFGSTVLTLAASQESAGAHSFSFSPANPTASPEVAAGGAIADGSYTVTLSYQDALGNPAAAVSAANVTVDTVTLPPTLIAPAVNAAVGSRMNVSFSLPEAALSGSVTLSFGTTVLTLASSLESAGTHTFLFDAEEPTASLAVASGSAIADGVYTVTLSYRDAFGNTPAVAIAGNVEVKASRSVLASTGAPVPGAGVAGSGIPAGAVWTGFGVPSVNASGQVAFRGDWRAGKVKGTGIFLDDALVVAKGAEFPALGEPMLGNDGCVGFVGKTGIFLKPPGGVLHAVAQVGDLPVDGGGAVLKKLGPVAMSESGGVFFFSAKLGQAVGALPKVAAGNDAVLCSVVDGSLPVVRLREGAAIAGAPVVKSFLALTERPGSTGNGRGVVESAGEHYVDVLVAGSRKEKVLGFVGSAGDSAFAYSLTTDAPGFAPGTKFAKFGLPTQDGRAAIAFRAAVQGGATAIFGEDENYELGRLVATGDSATGLPAGTTFAELRDPVASFEQVVAFTAKLSGGGTKAADNESVWFRNSAGALTLVAREGAPAAELGAKWKAFKSLALPEGALGPIIVASLKSTPTSKVTAANDVGLWATDSFGALRLLLREGDTIGAAKVKSFVVLPTVLCSAAQTRSFSSAGNVIVKATDTTGKQHLVHIAVP